MGLGGELNDLRDLDNSFNNEGLKNIEENNNQ
jgi:hypothetical protein